MDKNNTKNVVDVEEFEKVREGSGIGGKILAVSLGFIIGIGTTIGGLAAIGAIVLKRPIKDVENLAQKVNPDINLSEYLTEEYYNGTVINLLKAVKNAIAEISEGKSGFAALAKISPTVKTSVRDLAKKFKELGSNLNEDDIYNSLMNLPFSEFGTYLTQTLISSVEIGPMLLGSGTFTFDVLTSDNTMMTLLYGIEVEDYTISVTKDDQGNEIKEIKPVDGGRKPLSIGEMQNGGIEPIFKEIPVDALLTVNEDDGVMTALAYGASSHYTFVDSDKKDDKGNPIRVAQMKPRAYTSTDGQNFYDEEGQKLNCEATAITGVANAYKLTFKDEQNNVTDVQYVRLNTPTVAPTSTQAQPQETTYQVFKDEQMSKVLTFKKTSFADLMDNPEGLMETLEIASLMEVSADSNPVLIALAYGVEDEDYIIEEKEETDANGNKKITKTIKPLPGKQPKTLSQLQGEEMDDFINDLPLASLVEVNLDDDIIMTLAYGSSNKYTFIEQEQKDDKGNVIKDTDGNPVKVKTGVEMKQIEFTCINGEWFDIDNNKLNATFDEETGILTVKEETEQLPESGAGENNESNENQGGSTTKTTKEFYVVYNEDDEKYYQFDKEDHTKPVKYPKTTVGALQKDSSSLIDSMELAALLDVNANSNPMIIALSYGVENEDYIIEEKEETDANGNKKITKTIKPLPGKKPKTVGDLSNGGVDETIHNLPLDAMMHIDLEDGMMTSLAYGSSNKYTFVEEDKKDDKGNVIKDEHGNPVKVKTDVEMKQVEFTYKNDVWRDIDGNALTATFDSETNILTIDRTPTAENDESGTPTQKVTEDIYIVYNETAGKYYQFDKEDHTKPVKYEKTKVGKLQDNPASLIDELQLGEVLNITPETENPDRLLFALAYGNKGVHYDYDENGVFYFKEDENGTQYKARTLGDLRGEENLFNTIYIGDALDVTPASHSVLIALAYGEEGEDFEWVQKKDKNGNGVVDNSGEPVMEIRMLGNSKPRSINELQGSGSESLINSITVESALGITASSDSMMRALAYGQEGVHYEEIQYEDDGNGNLVPTTEKVQMKQAVYVPVYDQDQPEKIVGFLDRFEKQVNVDEPVLVDIQGVSVYEITVEDGSKQYVHPESFIAVTVENGVVKNVPYAKTTLGQLSNDSKVVMDGITMGDAMGIKKDEPDGLKRSLAFDKKGNPYTIGQLSDNPNIIINAMTLADALDVTPNSERMIIALAYGQKDVHYYIEETTVDGQTVQTIKPYHAFYTLEKKEDDETAMLYDRFGASYTLQSVTDPDYETYEAKLIIDGEVQYLDLSEDDGKYYVYDSEGNPVEFAPTTIGQLNSNDGNGSVIDSITLADALDVDKDDNSSENSLKHALAYSKDGYAYTIGDFADDPNAIVNNIEIDSVMAPKEGDATTMYLLYGKEGVHYAISEETAVADIPKDATIIPETYNEDKTRAKYVIMLDKVMTVHQKADHTTGEPVFNNGVPVMCVHNEYGESLGDNDKTGEQINHPIVKIGSNDSVNIDGYSCSFTEKYTYTFPNDNTTIYRLLLPSDSTLLEPIRVKGYYTYDHYEPAYLLQKATIDSEGNLTTEWITEKYQPNTIAALSESDLISHLTHRLTLSEVIDADLDETPILKPIAHTTIDELPGAVNSLTITEVFETDVYKTILIGDKKQVVNAVDQPIYYDRQTKKWYTTQTFEAGTESEPVLVSTWKYLLTDTTPTYVQEASGTFVYVQDTQTYREATSEELANSSIQKFKATYTASNEYTVNSMGELVENMTNNIQTATLKDLVDDGIITVSNQTAWENATHLHGWTIRKLLDNAMGITGED